MSLRVDHLSFAYHATSVIENLALEVHPGEFVSLIGPSGCGKSTLFLIIGGLLQPLTGEVWLNGERIDGERGNIGYMPQQYSLLPWYTVEENIHLGQKISGNSDLNQIKELLRKANLEEISMCYPHELSGGMRQRVAFIRALASNKSFLCLDEPFGALDALTRRKMYEWMASLREIEERTILFITHSVEEAVMLSDRIYLLSPRPMRIKGNRVVPFPQVGRAEFQGDQNWVQFHKEILSELE